MGFTQGFDSHYIWQHTDCVHSQRCRELANGECGGKVPPTKYGMMRDRLLPGLKGYQEGIITNLLLLKE